MGFEVRILVEQAREILELQGEEHDPETQKKKAELTERMNEKYQTLLQLSIVHDGGIGRYFTLAKKDTSRVEDEGGVIHSIDGINGDPEGVAVFHFESQNFVLKT